MHMVDFDLTHLPQARALAERHLHRERRMVAALPEEAIPDLAYLANGLGVAALEGDTLVGYLGAVGPIEGMFGTRAAGVFSPLEAHGVAEDSPRLWQRLLQAAQQKWVAAGAAYHAAALYAHDEAAKQALFACGFGQRCADAIRPAALLGAPLVEGVRCILLPRGEEARVRTMRQALDRHLRQSPCFQASNDDTCAAWIAWAEKRASRLFAALAGEEPIAFIEVMAGGENFLTEGDGMQNICGAYCVPDWRGKGVSRMLLDKVLHTLQEEGTQLLGVDYETMNLTAANFWQKDFTPYTASLVRRVDCLDNLNA